jgi:biopolymer transport protein ExbB
MNFGLKNTFALGWPILSVLLLCSIVCLGIAFQCWTDLRRSRRMVGRPTEKQLLEHFLDEVDGRLALLGTIANAAPFIGLLGTVIGIIRAFKAISLNTGGGIGMVAGGISEALISTAAGLAVAIPASMLFNYFTYHSQKLAKDAGIE